jgi:5'-nucleotidase
MKTILVTNDDGIYGAGLQPLVKELKKIAKVYVVVPDQERSGTGHSLTLHTPLRIQRINDTMHLVNGTPADCVRYGARKLYEGKIDLVVSGVNTGPNLAQDVVYSGTVAGAREGALLNIPSFAVSAAQWEKADFKLCSRVSAAIAKLLFARRLPQDTFLNINVPCKAKGYRVTKLGKRIYDEEVECRSDPAGREYYWLAGKFVSGVEAPGTDIEAVNHGYISITPLDLSPTATHLLDTIKSWINVLK